MSGARCIGTVRGTMTGTTMNQDFIIDANPLVCLPGHGAADEMTMFAGDRMRGQGVIDASPREVTIGGKKQLFLVYKTQGFAPSTIRMIQLSPDDGSSVMGQSHQLLKSIISTHNQGDTIEAPSLVQNGEWFTLFVAHGNFGTCNYSTQWYKSKNTWSWANTPTTLFSQANTHLCGPGSADVTDSQIAGESRIFLHGWANGNAPASGSAGAERVMYAAALTFSNGEPKLKAFLAPAN